MAGKRAFLGSSPALPVSSCQEIKNASEGLAPNGRYWLASKGAGDQPFSAYCDMDREVIVECPNNLCQNGAECDFYGKGQYKCRCLPGYTGKHCEIDIDECSSNPCLNGGTCIDLVNGYNCSCTSSLTGKHCELGMGAECSSYLFDTEEDRSIKYRAAGSKKCDSAFSGGWYRFNSTAGSKMPTSCVPKSMCNTDAPGWLSGNHPTLQEGIVTRTACFHWSTNCCNWKVIINVRNCGEFFVYKLVKPNVCTLRYCVTT